MPLGAPVLRGRMEDMYLLSLTVWGQMVRKSNIQWCMEGVSQHERSDIRVVSVNKASVAAQLASLHDLFSWYQNWCSLSAPQHVSHPSVGNCVTHLKPHSTVQKSQPALSLLPRLSFYKVVWSNYCPGFMDVFQTFSSDSRSQKSHNWFPFL